MRDTDYVLDCSHGGKATLITKFGNFPPNLLLMDRVECANCAQVLTAEGPCPRCGSTGRMRMINILNQMEIKESITMIFVAPVQIWTYLPAAIQSHLKTVATSQNDREIKGLCLESVISMAVFVEGFVTDYIELELEALLSVGTKKESLQKILNDLERKAWGLKKKVASDDLGWALESLDGFDMVELLFKLRNQIGHGRSYKLADRRHFRDNKLQRDGPIMLANKKYGEIYRELSSRGILQPIEQHPDMNVEMFLVPSVPEAFYENVVKFLRAFVKNIRLRGGVNMSDLLESILK